MEVHQKCPIAVLSFNRPDYLRTVLESLRKQKNCDIAGRSIVLFQDGATNPSSKRTYAQVSDLEGCIAVFRELIPHGTIFQSDVNLGIALNFERAENYCFETLQAEAAIFLEDDLFLSENYIAVLDRLIADNRYDKRVGYLTAYGDHTLSKGEQEASQHRLTTMHHNWGFALFRRQWQVMRPYVDQYLNVVRNNDYRLRDHGALSKLFASWGFGTPATSQDAAKTLACCLTSTIKVNTAACFGRYIGERGVHMDENEFRSRNYAGTYVFPHVVHEFETISENRYHQFRADLVHWAGRPGGGTGETAQRIMAEQLFHATNEQVRAGQLTEAARTACKGLSALFTGVISGFNVYPAFFPMASVRNQANESHVRFDIRGSTLRVLCPSEMLNPHFTNYFHAFALSAALLERVASRTLPDGGLTMDLGSGSNVGSYRRIAFSSALQHAELVLDPEFFISEGFTVLRDTFRQAERPWKERADVAFWRGNSTGAQVDVPRPGSEGQDWKWLQRLHFCAAARKSPLSERLNVGLSQIVQIEAQHLLNAISTANFLLGPESERDLVRYRYVFALDSNTSVGNGLIQAMLAGACVVLIESRFGFRSWYYDRLSPGKTHISVKADLSDLDEKLVWMFNHPDDCERIAATGRALADSMSYEAEFKRSAQLVRAIFGSPN